MGQFSLFGSEEPSARAGSVEIPAGEWDKKVKLGFEKEMLGLYVSDHPLLGVESQVRALARTSIVSLDEALDGSTVTVGGIVAGVNRRFTKGGELMLYFTLEDLEASVEVVCFPRVVAERGPFIREDAILIVKARVDQRGDDLKLIALDLSEPDLTRERAVRLRVRAAAMSADLVAGLRAVLADHPGTVPVFAHLESEDGTRVVRVGAQHTVEPRAALYADLRALLGVDSVLS
jgi:DNA polymerase-3 subunit alpha